MHPAETANAAVCLYEQNHRPTSYHRHKSEKRYSVSTLRDGQRRQPGTYRHTASSCHPIRSSVCSMLRRLAFRDGMGAPIWNMARSNGSNSPCGDLSECPPASHRQDQRLRPSARDVALGARPRPKELTHEGIRYAAGHRKRIGGGPYDPSRRRLDSGLFRLDNPAVGLTNASLDQGKSLICSRVLARRRFNHA